MPARSIVRSVVAGASTVRLLYGLGLLLAPVPMSRARLGAATPDNGMASMTTRAFGALHANLAAATLIAALADSHVELALTANVAADAGDAVGPLLEWRTGSLDTGLAVANTVLQSFGIVTWTWALRALHRQEQPQ